MKKKAQQKQHSAVLPLALFFGVVAVVIGVLIFLGAKRAPQAAKTPVQTSAATTAGSSEVPPQAQGANAQTYYAENAERVLAVTPAQQSSYVYSEKLVAGELGTRGFGENAPITYSYALDGSVEEKTEVDTSSTEAHPQYTTLYETASGDYWTITVCNGCVTAYPVTYNLEHNNGAEVILTESESITAYDSATNSFYEMIPKNSVLVIKRIPAITAEALEALTAEEIEKL